MKPIIPRDSSLVPLKDKELMEMVSSAPALVRTRVFHEIALRRHQSSELNQVLKKSLIEEKNRKEIFFGFIKVAWIPIIDILEEGNKDEVVELINTLKNSWSQEERKNLYEYLKKDFDIKDILD